MTQPLPFTDVLRLLFTYRTRPDGKPYKAVEVARATGISPAQLSVLLNGQRQNTSIEFARALLRFFDVPIQILDATSEQQVIDLIGVQQPQADASIRLRGQLSKDLSSRALDQIETLIEYVLQREHAARHGEPPPPLPDFREDQTG